MTGYLVQRIGQAVAVLWAAFTVAFILLQMMPGDAVLIRFLGSDFGLSPEQIAQLRVVYGADAPVWQQYLATLGNALFGNFGFSVVSGTPVSQEILTNLPPTLRLAGISFAVAVLLALGTALLATLPRFHWLRDLFQALPGLMISVPVFWLAIVLIQIFSFKLGWVSVINPGPVERMILPIIAIAVPISAPLAQILIRNIDQVSTSGFVPVARAKGASRSFAILRHVIPNALLPTLTIAGVLFGELVAGAVVTETVFGLNGLGRLAERSVRFQDAAVLQAVVLIAAAGFVIVNLIVDLLYPILDPRLRAGRRLPA
ncbi:ABC transporter permease [Ketogulonicigenium vulgare]|uniref:ABC transporter permease protein n=1 Tax=Ketogulonicigenium vulgare (strain WSH-001) TaxID=759362 RepID=F9Y6F9_KETVW|nr:ABC transporter permease [Ketogulonicigenium vulgare]AEM40905.1 ABC transporter permease protein [Ketogulonicigenium vulgare WSH-001]ALJ81059.1 peptide ABC transporter permease [Ketogulonicigenium vulgare]ANW33814.1 peptide ABC transporter permease [Ketogulonicigenium vulgare]AOZ54623.1 ABC transporter permease protein [Ketogulonicigenium vulgare]